MTTKKGNYLVLRKEPKIIDLEDDKEIFGEIKELISKELGSGQTGVGAAEVTLWGPDFIHHHRKTGEIYIWREGKGKIFLDGEILPFNSGARIIIGPGTNHAAAPDPDCVQLVFLCISVPAFDPIDFHKDPRGREW